MGAGCRGFPAKETLAAKDRAALSGPERDGSFPPALRADGCRLYSLRAGSRRSLTLTLTSFAALGFILEIFIVEEVLLSRCKNELGATISALEDSILKLWHHHHSRGPTQTARSTLTDPKLFHLATIFLPVSLASQSLLDSLFFTRLQIKRVPFDLFDNVLLLHLAFEPAKGVF